MGEIFEQTVPAVPLTWTGERLTTGAGAQVEIEHIHRYLFARSLCRGLDVLDVASGEGYGSAFLAQTAKSVTAVELDEKAVTHAASVYRLPNLKFVQGDARCLPLSDCCIDIIVSFETIEHFSDHDAFLAEVKRVLRPGGRFIVSSPERDVYSPAGAAANPYHVRELTRSEFWVLLRKYFEHVFMHGQRPLLGSAIIAEGGDTTALGRPTLVFERRGPTSFEVSEGLPRAVYLLATASNAPIEDVSDSLYIETSSISSMLVDLPAIRDELLKTKKALGSAGVYARHVEENLSICQNELNDSLTTQRASHNATETQDATLSPFRGVDNHDSSVSGIPAIRPADVIADAEITELHVQHLNDVIARLEHVESNLRQIVSNLSSEQSGQPPELTSVGLQNAELRLQLASILGSTSWRLTGPLRSLLTARPGLKRALRRLVKFMWWTLTKQLAKKIVARRRIASSKRLADIHKVSVVSRLQGELATFLKSGISLVFVEVQEPDVSIIIVVWNHAYFTLACLKALSDQQGPSFEIIVVDNASSDETPVLLSMLRGVRVVRNAENVGFLLGCNYGAASARGRALLLLNSDAFLRPGSLAAALAILDSTVDIGAVGARIILPSGKLQEAGSIIWTDGSTAGYGRGLDPETDEVMFRRDVDYCSGAFLLTPRLVWERLGGFDEAFSPAYYEETDYCMRLRGIGYRVVYEPTVIVDHFEFGSEKKEGDAINLSQQNRQIFVARYHDTLQQKHFPFSDTNINAARTCQTPKRPRLLFIDNEVPFGSLGSGYPRAREMLVAAVSLGWLVTLYPLHRREVDWTAVRAEIPWEVEIISSRTFDSLTNYLRERSGSFDVVLVSRPENMAHLRGVLRQYPHLLDGIRLIYDAEALNAARDIIKAKIVGLPISDTEADALVSSELALVNGVDAVACVSDSEATFFHKTGVPTYILSHTLECSENSPGWELRIGFLFVGRLLEKEAPNWRGLAWFIRQSWPLIRAKLPQATLTVIGHLHPDHSELVAPGVRLMGPISDLRPVYNAARVFVAPIQFASGIPLKVLEAAAYGLPVVGTSLMATQLSWEPDVEIAAADAAGAFAEAAVTLHNKAIVWEAMRVAAQSRIKNEHSASLFEAQMKKILGP